VFALKALVVCATQSISISHHFGGVDSGTSLEECTHHTAITLRGCHH